MNKAECEIREAIRFWMRSFGVEPGWFRMNKNFANEKWEIRDSLLQRLDELECIGRKKYSIRLPEVPWKNIVQTII